MCPGRAMGVGCSMLFATETDKVGPDALLPSPFPFQFSRQFKNLSLFISQRLLCVQAVEWFVAADRCETPSLPLVPLHQPELLYETDPMLASNLFPLQSCTFRFCPLSARQPLDTALDCKSASSAVVLYLI